MAIIFFLTEMERKVIAIEESRLLVGPLFILESIRDRVEKKMVSQCSGTVLR